jgi:phosphoribosylformylglycinamidine synthase
MTWKIEIVSKHCVCDAAGTKLKNDILSLGFEAIERVRVARLYFLEGSIDTSVVEEVCTTLLCDPITEDYSIESSQESYGPESQEDTGVWHVSVVYNPGVMDPVEASILKALSDLGIDRGISARTGSKYSLYGNLSGEEIEVISRKLLFNPLIQHPLRSGEKLRLSPTSYRFKPSEIRLAGMDRDELSLLSRNRQLFLSGEEMVAIRDYYRTLGRNPTDCELETFAQTWSEHCSHKTFRGVIRYGGQKIDNLLKQTIMRVTEELSPEWCVSVFEDNAGIIEWDDDHNLCFKVETHNHPSALEPYGGAGTGIGGVIRDALGTGLGGKPICNTDVFCFGPLDYAHSELPPGTLHPRRILAGVVAGVRDYGNRMGIPTLNGSIYFDERYLGNPVVYCGTVGILPKHRCKKAVMPGDRIVLVGGRTGKDGIHGVTFSSAQLTQESEDVSAQAVQIGNPITEKKVLDTLMQARDMGLYNGITDCGGGGLSSAVGEMGRETGAKVKLDKVPLKYRGLSYTDIWISESQERMVLAVPPSKVDDLINLFSQEDVEATVIGEFTGDSRLTLSFREETVCDIPMDVLHSIPKLEKKAVWKRRRFPEPRFDSPADLTPSLLQILSSPNVCSKEWVIRQYDHEVQGGSVVKPLVGVENDGPSDAAVIRPLLHSPRGVVVSNGMNPKYGDIDPYWMAASAVDEAIRNCVAVGGSPHRTALLDNFSWGSSNDPQSLGALTRAAQGCYEVARAYRTPFISGKDSLNNEYEWQERTISIPHTLLISALSLMENCETAVTLDLKDPGDLIYLIGLTYAELGGSHYYALSNLIGNSVPRVDPVLGPQIAEGVSRCIDRRYLKACHDLSEGGLGVALAEMAFAGGLGAEVDLRKVALAEEIQRDDTILFSESNSRFLVEVSPSRRHDFESTMEDVPFSLLGEVNTGRTLVIHGLSGRIIVKATLERLKGAWQSPLPERLQ